jgi:hypothetical protein
MSGRAVEACRAPAEVFVPQTHHPGDEAEVGFGDVVIRLAGPHVRCFLFCLRLSFSGKAVQQLRRPGPFPGYGRVENYPDRPPGRPA